MKYVLYCIMIMAGIASCKKDDDRQPMPQPEPVKDQLLKDIVIPNLPSPYYHFEYDQSGRMIKTSHASGFRMYDIIYDNGKIAELKNNTAVNKDRLQYMYNAKNQAELVTYRNEAGSVYRFCSLFYNQQGQLTSIEWESRVDIGFAMERTIEIEYLADGNISKLADHRFALGNQPEATHITTFEQYDSKVCVDDFSLFHDDNDHMLIVPGLRLQKNNPAKLTRTGTGVNYVINLTYTYNTKDKPLVKAGDAVFTSGPNAGQHWQTRSDYTYY